MEQYVIPQGGRARGQAHRSEVLVPLPAIQTGSWPTITRRQSPPSSSQGFRPWLRSSATSGLVLATQKLGGITGRGTRCPSQVTLRGWARAWSPGRSCAGSRPKDPVEKGEVLLRARHRESDAGGRGRGDGRPPEDPRRRGRGDRGREDDRGHRRARGGGARSRPEAEAYPRRSPLPPRPRRPRPPRRPCRQGRGAARAGARRAERERRPRQGLAARAPDRP